MRARGRAAPLDSVDRQIVAALQQDGRRPFTRIARDLGISEAAVRQRVARLERAGVMQVVAVADPITCGFKTMAMLAVRVEPRVHAEVVEALRQLPEVAYLVVTAGQFDLLAEVICEDNDHLLRLLSEELAALDGVSEIRPFVYLRLVKEAYTWSLGGSDEPAAPAAPAS
jgi:Lrp/AsnC family transcriptional regulator for asnA, asnC and gidA